MPKDILLMVGLVVGFSILIYIAYAVVGMSWPTDSFQGQFTRQ